MRAIQYQSKEQPLALSLIDDPVAGIDEVIVNLKYSALNHRDVFITKGLYPNLRPGTVLGSDGVGEWQGKEYLINPNIDWGPDQQLPADEYHILGMPDDGTFAEKIAIHPDRLVRKPEHLTSSQAAALPLAGLTAYRVLFSRCQLSAEDRLLVNGIGGGVALFVLQFALAIGAEVWITSSSQEKIDRARGIGATGGILYSEDNWHKSLKKNSGGFDVIIDSAGGAGFSQLISTANKGARIGIYGGSCGPILNLSPQVIFWKHLNIFGSTMGSDQDFTAMVDFVDQYTIVPVVDSVFALADFKRGFDRMDHGLQFGKIVLDNRRLD
ncbi:MAG: zinc-binding dehydrogenase [Saprospiraceae bacterium]|nr:zinc-binding dehydrogenase [Saprospiraceae bacterium]